MLTLTKKTMTDWTRVLRSMRDSAHREAKRWDTAGWDAANAKGLTLADSNLDPTIARCRVARDRCYRAISEMSLALAIEEAGRDITNLDDAILSCFDKTGAHKVATITNRLFKTTSPESDQYDLVERSLRRLEKAGKLFTRPHEKTYETLYMLATPERVKARKAVEDRRLAAMAKQKADEARQDAFLKRLHAQGYASAREDPHTYDQIVISINDVERLLGLLGVN